MNIFSYFIPILFIYSNKTTIPIIIIIPCVCFSMRLNCIGPAVKKLIRLEILFTKTIIGKWPKLNHVRETGLLDEACYICLI